MGNLIVGSQLEKMYEYFDMCFPQFIYSAYEGIVVVGYGVGGGITVVLKH